MNRHRTAIKLTERLRVEHQVFRQILDLIEISLSLPREPAALELRVALRILQPSLEDHERLEDRYLFPGFKRKAGGALLQEYSGTHRDIWKTLRYLREALDEDAAPGTIRAAAERLVFVLREHMLEEERVLFPAVEAALGEEALLALSVRAAAASRRGSVLEGAR